MALEITASGLGIVDREQALVEEARTDRDAFCRLYEAYYPRIYSFVLKRVGSPHDAEDVTERTFEKALRSLGSYDPRKGNFSAWLYRIAINATNDFFKSGKGGELSMDEIGGALTFETEDESAAVRSYVDVMNLIRQIDRTHQVIIILRYFEEMDHEQMAQVLDCSRKAVSMRVTRALKALRKVMEREGFTRSNIGGVR